MKTKLSRKFPKSNIELLQEQITTLSTDVEQLPSEIESSVILPIFTPVNAVAASKVLTVSNTPAEGDTVTIDDVTYKARLDALGVGVAASKNLYLNSNPLEGDTITIGGVVYKFRVDALGAGVAASAVLTSDETAPTDGDTVTIGTRVYRLKDSPSQANDIAISTAEVTMTRLFKAINGTGIAGSDYFAGTAVPDVAVTAVNTSAFVVTITANSVGFAGNSFFRLLDCVNLSWDTEGDYFTGGIDAQAANDVYRGGGTSACINNLVIAINTGYSAGVVGTGTVAHTTVSASKVDTQNVTITAKTLGFAGNDIALAKSLDDVASVWFEGATELSGGIDPEAANDIYCTTAETFIDNLVAAIADNGTPGTEYGTLTEVHPTCTAAKLTAATMSCTYKTKGIIGTGTNIRKSGTNLSWAGSATALSGGVDGTPGEEAQTFFESSKLWVCNATDLTSTNDNWLSTTLT